MNDPFVLLGYSRENDFLLREIESREHDDDFHPETAPDETVLIWGSPVSGAPIFAREIRANGKLRREVFLDQGCSHRIGGPAEIEYGSNGEAASVEWWRHNRPHRIDGGAEWDFGSDGTPGAPSYYVAGELVTDLKDFPWVVCAALSRDEVRAELAAGHLAPLLAEGMDPNAILDVVATGIRTLDGARALLGGAPVEWAIAYEGGLSS